MSQRPLSVVYVTQDCAVALQRSLQSIDDLADEILVVDGGSRDDTMEVARAAGARVLQHSWAGFAAQRQYAVEQAANDWILMLDSDELLTDCGREEIRQVLQQKPEAAAYLLPRYSVFRSRRIRHGDWRHDVVIRLFDRRQGQYDLDELVHEAWRSRGKSAQISCPCLEHHSYVSYAQLLAKAGRYTELNAQKVVARGRSVGPWAPMSHALWAFFRGYVLRLGFLDGVEGGAIAWTTALGAYFKYAIARDLLAAQAGKRR